MHTRLLPSRLISDSAEVVPRNVPLGMLCGNLRPAKGPLSRWQFLMKRQSPTYFESGLRSSMKLRGYSDGFFRITVSRRGELSYLP